jgi:hypothetical protein
MAGKDTQLDELLNYLQAEKQSLEQLIDQLSGKLAKVEALLIEHSRPIASGGVTERRSDPFKTLDIWPMTSPTTMGRCREALGMFGREATAAEIAGLIRRHSDIIPAKSITEMLYKCGSKEQRGIYRAHRKPGPAKYGLIAWRKGSADLSADGGFQAPDEAMDI